MWAVFYHRQSTDEKPCHMYCPPGESSWCSFNKAEAINASFLHRPAFPEPATETIRPIYVDLSKEDLLKKCLHGRTQNPNESVNNCIWKKIPKIDFVSLTTLQFGVADAILCFNEGLIAKVNVLKHWGIEPGMFMIEGLETIDRRRVFKAEKECREQNKKEG